MARQTQTLCNAALTLAAAAITAAGLAHGIHAHTQAADLPLNCEIAVTAGGFGQTYRGVITATAPVAGHFEMAFGTAGRSNSSVKQAGRFALDTGESATLGQASFGGGADVDATLKLTFDGTTMICTTNPGIDL